MKPTENQKRLIESIGGILKDCLSTWESSNDIDSPSHYTLIEESVELADLEISDDQKSQLEDAIELIYSIVINNR